MLLLLSLSTTKHRSKIFGRGKFDIYYLVVILIAFFCTLLEQPNKEKLFSSESSDRIKVSMEMQIISVGKGGVDPFLVNEVAPVKDKSEVNEFFQCFWGLTYCRKFYGCRNLDEYLMCLLGPLDEK